MTSHPRSLPGTAVWAVALLVLGIYLSPFVVLGQDANVRIHDNLDSTRAPLRADPSLLFAPSDDPIPQLMNGVPRRAFDSEVNLEQVLFTILPRYEAYVVNQLLLRLSALFSLFLLLGLFVSREQDPWGLVRIGTATCFALVPFYARFGGTLPGMALQTWALISIWRGNGRRRHWIALALVPLYSKLFMGPVFLFLGAGFVWLAQSIVRRRANLRVFAALALSTVAYLLCEYRLVLAALGGSAGDSHRAEFGWFAHDLRKAYEVALALWLDGHHDHGATFARAVIWPAIAAGLVLALAMRMRGQGTKRRPLVLGVCVLGAVGLSLWAGLYRWTPVQHVMSNLGALQLIQWDRTYLLLPVVTYFGFGIALAALSSVPLLAPVLGRVLVVGVLLAQGLLLFGNSDQQRESEWGHASFRAFFATKQMQEIQDFIGKDPSTYRVVSIGMYPSIPAESGMYCLDAYVSDYPLTYKHRFRRIIQGELAKSDRLREYFDGWGSRCYVFVDELDRQGARHLNRKEPVRTLTSLDLDLDALYELGGRYVLSVAKLDPGASGGLQHLRTFEHDESAWTIHLYVVMPPG